MGDKCYGDKAAKCQLEVEGGWLAAFLIGWLRMAFLGGKGTCKGPVAGGYLLWGM